MLRIFSNFRPWYEAGSLISFLALLAIGIASFFLLRSAFKPIPSFIGALVSICSPTVVRHAVGYSSDLPAFAFAFVSISFLAYWYKRRVYAWLFLAGIFAGLSYLTRYTSLSLFLGIAIMLIAFPDDTWRLRRLSVNIKVVLFRLSIFVAGWLLSASPQLLASWLVHGNPLYTENGCNIALAIGENRQISGLTWLNVKDVFPQCASVLKTIADYPLEFISNYIGNIVEAISIIGYRFFLILTCFCLLLFPNDSAPAHIRAQKMFIFWALLVNSFLLVLIASLAFVTERHLMLATTFIGSISAAMVSSYLMDLNLGHRRLSAYWIGLPFSIFSLYLTISELVQSFFQRNTYEFISYDSRKSVQVAQVLDSVGCIYLNSGDGHGVNTVLVGDDLVDPSRAMKIGIQAWRWEYTPFQSPDKARQWMIANQFKCIVLDEVSLAGRIPTLNYELWKKEYESGFIFPRRWRSSQSGLYVFSLE